MSINVVPKLAIDGLFIAGAVVDGWQSIALAGLTMSYGGRTAAVDSPSLPTATAYVLVPADATASWGTDLIRRAQGLEAEIWITGDGESERVFKGFVEAPRVSSTRLRDGRLAFRVELPLTSRPAALNGVLFHLTNSECNRGAEKASTRLAWLNKVMTAESPAQIRQEFHYLTPLFDSTSGALSDWNYYVPAKDYRGQSVISAWSDIAAGGAEFTEYKPSTNRLSALGRIAKYGDFTRLGWVDGRVNVVTDYTGYGTVLDGTAAAMADVTYSDAGTVSTVRVTGSSTVLGDGSDDEQSTTLFGYTDDRRGSRRAEVSVSVLDRYWFDANDDVQQDGAITAALGRYIDLYNDVALPIHPAITRRFTDGFESWDEARRWLVPSTYSVGPVYVAGSVFNLIRPGTAFSAQGGVTATWEAFGDSGRRWNATMQLFPIANDGLDHRVTIGEINPSATATAADAVTFQSITADWSVDTVGALTAEALAADVATSTGTKFTYADMHPSFRISTWNDVAKGL